MFSAANASVGVSASVGLLVGLAGFLFPFALLFSEKWRMFGVGILIGYSVLLILAAGACVAVFFSFANSYN